MGFSCSLLLYCPEWCCKTAYQYPQTCCFVHGNGFLVASEPENCSSHKHWLWSLMVQANGIMLSHPSNLPTYYTKPIACYYTALRQYIAADQSVSVLANLQWQRGRYNTSGNYVRVQHQYNASFPPLGSVYICVTDTDHIWIPVGCGIM